MRRTYYINGTSYHFYMAHKGMWQYSDMTTSIEKHGSRWRIRRGASLWDEKFETLTEAAAYFIETIGRRADEVSSR